MTESVNVPWQSQRTALCGFSAALCDFWGMLSDSGSPESVIIRNIHYQSSANISDGVANPVRQRESVIIRNIHYQSSANISDGVANPVRQRESVIIRNIHYQSSANISDGVANPVRQRESVIIRNIHYQSSANISDGVANPRPATRILGRNPRQCLFSRNECILIVGEKSGFFRSRFPAMTHEGGR